MAEMGYLIIRNKKKYIRNILIVRKSSSKAYGVKIE